MNLVAKEFVAAREDLGGVLVLSELTGAAQELTDALIINPYHVDGFAQALERAIDMPLEERARRMRALRRVVAGRDVFRWASDILDQLEELPESRGVVERGLPPRAALNALRRRRRAHRMSEADVRLAAESFEARAAGRHLLLLCDFDGTLCEFHTDPRPSGSRPSRRALLEAIAQRPARDVRRS